MIEKFSHSYHQNPKENRCSLYYRNTTNYPFTIGGQFAPESGGQFERILHLNKRKLILGYIFSRKPLSGKTILWFESHAPNKGKALLRQQQGFFVSRPSRACSGER